MPLPRVSIITPVFNSERFLSRYFNNLLLQDYDNLEIVIMDNASTDQSLEIIAEFSNNLDIKVKSEKDKGIYDAMNKGLQQATGDYIVFMNAGDRFPNPDTLDKVVLAAVVGDGEEKHLGTHSQRGHLPGDLLDTHVQAVELLLGGGQFRGDCLCGFCGCTQLL